MSRILFIFLFFITISASAQYRKDSAIIVDLLKADYATLGNFDAKKHSAHVTYDFMLVEDGQVWTLDRELQYFAERAAVKQTRKDQFTIHSVKISGTFAYAVYNLNSEITTAEKVRNYHWLETAIFRKTSNQWKISLIHSTEVMPSQ